jgi:hypothetical protein
LITTDYYVVFSSKILRKKERESTMATDGMVASWTSTEILGHPIIQHTDSAGVNTVLQKKKRKGKGFFFWNPS